MSNDDVQAPDSVMFTIVGCVLLSFSIPALIFHPEDIVVKLCNIFGVSLVTLCPIYYYFHYKRAHRQWGAE